MKKIFALIVCLCMLLCACGTAAPDEPQQLETPAPSVQQPEVPKSPVLRTKRVKLTDDSMEAVRLDAAYDAVSVDGAGFEALGSALQDWNLEQENDLRATAGEVVSDLTEAASHMPETSFALEKNVSVIRADAQYVCLEIAYYSSLGGVHPFTDISSVCFDTQTGRRLQLTDVAADYDAVYNTVLQALDSYDGREEVFFEDYADTVYDMFYTNENYTLTWLLGEDTLTIVFSEYAIAPYAFGPTRVELPFTDGVLAEGASGTVITTFD